MGLDVPTWAAREQQVDSLTLPPVKKNFRRSSSLMLSAAARHAPLRHKYNAPETVPS
jgi:hypothetical protein